MLNCVVMKTFLKELIIWCIIGTTSHMNLNLTSQNCYLIIRNISWMKMFGCQLCIISGKCEFLLILDLFIWVVCLGLHQGQKVRIYFLIFLSIDFSL